MATHEKRAGGTIAAAAAAAALMTTACATADRVGPPPARTQGFVETDDGTPIYYERIGSGPAVLLIHGLGGNHAVWYHQVPAFADRHTVITVSQRGFAPSGGARTGHALEVLIADAIAVLDALSIERVSVIGQSMGGWTALGLALERPERVRSVVLADTLAGISDAVIARHYRTMTDRARALAERPPPLAVHPALAPEFSRAHPAEAYLYQTLSSFGSPPPAEIAARLGQTHFDGELLSANIVPALFVVGEYDTIFPPAMVTRAAARLPRSTVVVVPDTGHSPYYERPSAWNAVVLEFVDGRARERRTLSVRRNASYELVRPGRAAACLSRRARTIPRPPR